MQNRLVRRHGLDRAEVPAEPLAVLEAPEQRGGQVRALPVLPALRCPPVRVVVAAVRDEALVGGVGDGGGVQQEGGQVDDVGRALVVQRPRLSFRTHGERPRRDEHFGGQCGRVGGHGRRWGSGQGRLALAELVGDQHRLVVLLLVLGDHPEREPGLQQRRTLQRAGGEQVQHPAAHVVGVGAGLGGRQQRQAGALGPGVLEGVVQRVDLRVHRVPAADVAQQPELLLVADVREVPDQRGHQRGVLGGEVAVPDAVGQRGGPGAGGQQLGGDGLPQVLDAAQVLDVARALGAVRRLDSARGLGPGGGGCGRAVRSDVGHGAASSGGVRRVPERRASSWSSAGQRPRAG